MKLPHLTWAVIAVAAAARVYAYLASGAFWGDEAGLAMNIVGRGTLEIGHPYLYRQFPPYLFVLAQKGMTLAFGASEHVLRLLPCVAGVLLLPLVASLARRLHGATAGLLAALLLAPSPLLIEYAAELKPYSLDATVAALLLWAGHAQLSAPTRGARVALAALGVVVPWVSLPSIFVLAGLGLALGMDALSRRAGVRALVVLSAIGGSWLASFAVHYRTFLRVAQGDAQGMERYFTVLDAFAPFPPDSLSDLAWYPGKALYIVSLFVAPAPYAARFVAGALLVLGVFTVWRTQRAFALALLAPAVLLFGASAAHKYLIVDRLVLFLAPSSAVLVAVGLSGLAQRLRRFGDQVAAVLALALAAAPTVALAHELVQPPATRDIRTLVAELARSHRPGDRLYVESQVDWIYTYYARRARFEVPRLVGDARDRPVTLVLGRLDSLRGAPRVWVLLPAVGRQGPRYAAAVQLIEKSGRVVTEHLRTLGTQLHAVDGGNVMLYLYDLSRRPRAAP